MIRRLWPIAVFITLATAFLGRLWMHLGPIWAFTLFDDQMISMRYAQHLAHGQGLVWNLGEKPIEGFTNLGWVLVMAAVHLVKSGSGAAFTVATISAALWGLAAIGAADLAHFDPTKDEWDEMGRAPTIAFLLTLFCYPLAYWSCRGTEVPALACCVTWAMVWRDCPWKLAGLCAAAVLIRDDGVVPMFAVVYGVSYVATKPSKNFWRWYLAAAVLGLAVLGKVAWRQWYFGDFVPNTAHLKLDHFPLADRLARGGLCFLRFLERGGWVWALLVPKRDRMRLIPVAVCCAYSIFVGGDSWEDTFTVNRFICVGAPIAMSWVADAVVEQADVSLARLGVLAILPLVWVFPLHPLGGISMDVYGGSEILLVVAAVLYGISWMWRAVFEPGTVQAMQVVILVFAMSGPAWIGWVKLNAEDLNVDSLRVVHGLAIKASTSPDATIAVTPCGSIPYFSERRTLDILGKSDAVIAREPPKGLPFFPGHSKWNLQHTIGEGKPDMIDELYTAKKEDLRYVYDQGYTPISAALWWRNDSNKAHSLAFVVEAGRLGAYH